MKRLSFLNKLRDAGSLELVDASDEICSSYLEKADNCLKSARLLLDNNLYENSVSMSYYVMYNSLTALLFKLGIKCENHSGSILVFGRLFGRNELFKTISFAKKERIDKQYYVTSKKDFTLTKESAQDMLSKAEEFIIQMRLLIDRLSNDDIKRLRFDFSKI